ncbi:MAG TPA: hypothetical protein VN328_12805 [Thermodesulfovibrionales bacterium]|nr:hypothetical protein [Thermodesulfovibrionales bacterium]
MAERHREREIQMLYSYDRLGDQKLSQIYRLLVPDKMWSSKDEPRLAAKGDGASEDSSALCSGIVGEAKRRANHR